MSFQAHAEKTKKPCISGVGVASWYNVESSSKTTASGKQFNDRDPRLIANKICPEGTEVYVTFLETGTTIGPIVVKDYGPNKKGRDWDLSEAAAEELGIKEVGVARVLVQVVNN